jgi:hypothetical protein
MNASILRRLASTAAIYVLVATAIQAEEPQTKLHRINLAVSETAGIRRFGYPVNVILPLPEPVKSVDDFRLLSGDKPVTAQFRPHGDTSKGIQSASLDFNVSPGPLKSEEYVVEYGSGAPGTKPKTGLRVETTEKEFRVIHPSDLAFVLSRRSPGVIEQVKTGKTNYLRKESKGLIIGTKAEKSHALGTGGSRKSASKVIREGPLAVALRFEDSETLESTGQVGSIVEMEFPLSKSWVRVNWIVDDRLGKVLSLGADLNLHVEGEPTLFDFGAGTSVYGQLRRDETAIMRQNARGGPASWPAWDTFLSPKGQLKQYVSAPGSVTPPARDAEGWAHVMDRERCTAVAVADFAAAEEGGVIMVDADGRLQLWRQFGTTNSGSPRGAKKLTFWLHFVGMPVHVGAATSPQAMLSPLKVEIIKKP